MCVGYLAARCVGVSMGEILLFRKSASSEHVPTHLVRESLCIGRKVAFYPCLRQRDGAVYYCGRVANHKTRSCPNAPC